MAPLLYLDQNYLSGIAKRKPAFADLEPELRAAVRAGVIAVPESAVHPEESAPRPDLGLLGLLRSLSGGLRLPEDPGPEGREIARRLGDALRRELPERSQRSGDAADLRALAIALPRCRFVTCDATMADVIRRTRLDVRYGTELFSGRRRDVEQLRSRLAELRRSG
jgi:hypothetical protein